LIYFTGSARSEREEGKGHRSNFEHFKSRWRQKGKL